MRIIVINIAALLFITAVPAVAQQFVAPPRTIADITAILDQEKPDPNRTMAVRARADAQPPGGSGAEVARFYYNRCLARGTLGEFRKAIADCQQAEQLGRGSLALNELGRLRQGLALQYSWIGDPKKALAVLLQFARETNVKGSKGFAFNANRHITDTYILLGDFNQAEAFVRRNQALLQEAKGWPTYAGFRRASWNADVELGRARLLEARGQFREAEQSYKRAEALRREALSLLHTYGEGLPPPRDQLESAIDVIIAQQGRMKARQGRIAEGEADVRRALLSRLKANGKYNLGTNDMVAHLANMLVEQGRFAEAEQLTRVQIDVQKALGVPQDAQIYANSLSQLSSILNLLGRWDDAAKVYAELEAATKSWEPARREGLQLNSEHIATLYNTNNLKAGLAAAERLLARQKLRFGEQHVDTALSRGLLAIGFSRSGRDADALREFKLAVPILMARSRETDDEDATTAAAREQRAQIVVEAYIALLARMGSASGVDAAAESFRLADAVRSRSVQRALAASSARATAANPALADLVRKTPGYWRSRLAPSSACLTTCWPCPAAERDEKALKTLQADIEKMRSARDAAKKELAGKFRNYASLVEPAPPTADDMRAVMQPDEAFLSFYFGRDASFVWAVGKTGPVAFAAIAATAGDIDKKVQTLREALEPNATMISEIPPFDVALAHELYTLLLKPVEAGWKSAKNLIVTTNGALGLLPLGLLTTAPADVKSDGQPIFSGYRNVRWLARTHAVTLVPSAAALRTLRQLPPASEQARADDRLWRSGVQPATGHRNNGGSASDRGANPRPTAGAPQRAADQGRRQRAARPPAASARHHRRTQVHRDCVAGRPRQGAQPRQSGERRHGEKGGSIEIQDHRVRHPRTRARRTRWTASAGACLERAGRRRCARRRPADHGGNPHAQARRRLGRPVRLQHRRGRRRGRRSRIRSWPGVLLRRHARDPGDQLVGAFGLGARVGQRPVCPPDR